MDLNFSPEIEAFRQEVRTFIRENLPADVKRMAEHEQHELEREDQMRWHRILHKKGWSVPSWPVEYGGPGWNHEQQYVFEQELAANGAPRLTPFGWDMLGPTIIEFGTKAQQERFLPGIISGEVWWCQGFSEPNAGSDLASLQCKAVRDGDHYVLNGQKTWTSTGHKADLMFGLFRTDSSGKRQHGITFLLLDMKSPGITLTPIITFDGGYEVNQTFFDDVRVPLENRIGEESKGWTIAKYLLGLERLNIAEVARSRAMIGRLKKISGTAFSGGRPLIEDRDFSERIAEMEIDLRALELTEQRFLFGGAGVEELGAEASILKIRGTEIQQKATEMAVEALGYYAQPYVPEQLTEGYNEEMVGGEATGYAAISYFNLRKTSIYGGTNEIQRNIVAKAVLGL